MLTQRLFPSAILSGFLIIGVGLSSAVYAGTPNGEHLYTKNCSVCHGSKGSGGVGIPLDLASFLNSISDEYLIKTIEHGRVGRTMPAFKKLGDENIKALVKYIRSFTETKTITFDPTPIKGNIQHGKALFKSKCASCHGDHGQGGKGTGVTFSRPRDLSIIPPALNNAGFLASASDEMIKHTLINGRDKTPMNSFLKQGMSESDINDVVAYIRHFETKQVPKLRDQKLDAIIVEESPYSLEKTLDNLKKAVIGKNFRIIRQQTLDDGLADKGKQNKKQIILYFCNFQFLNESLALDPRIGLFLPCRVTIVQQGNSVKVMAINPLRLSKLFNNDELDDACKSMSNLYTEIIEEATL
ncbi:Cytochrome c family protein [hydrothermal vent metagenome]|uniref:Cytochrome c family protein n=1 Tax=hydrothermal vent metagenome TaxID=652676 RepID=A0A3B1AIF7_9ZZZZ